MGYRDTLLGLLPPVSYARNAYGQINQAEVDARVLDGVSGNSDAILNAVTPKFAGSCLSDWERILAIKNDTKPYAYRVNVAVAKINATGGLSIPYFANLAAASGYDIHITEEDRFRAGVSCAGENLNLEESRWRWCVDVADGNASAYIFRAGTSRAGERITIYIDPIIETIFEELKPAWTYCRFEY